MQFNNKCQIGIVAQEVEDVHPLPVDLYDDGPVDMDYVPEEYRTFERISWYRLKQMIERWPAMRKSWEAFIIDYHMCLSTLQEEEEKDDIPF